MPNGTYDLQNELVESVRSPRFVPFLGPEASTLRITCPREWEKVSYRLKKLYSHVHNGGEDTDSKGDERYLESLAKAYHFNAKFDEIKNGTGAGDQSNEDEKESDNLLELQYWLVKLGAIFVKLFGERMVESRACVDNLADYKVSIGDHSPLIDEAIEYLFKALDETLSYMNSSSLEFPVIQ
jgi:hypothetical protein